MVFESSVQQFQAVKPGSYEICFSNEMARWTPKIIAFDLTVDGSEPAPSTTNVLTSGTIEYILLAYNKRYFRSSQNFS